MRETPRKPARITGVCSRVRGTYARGIAFEASSSARRETRTEVVARATIFRRSKSKSVAKKTPVPVRRSSASCSPEAAPAAAAVSPGGVGSWCPVTCSRCRGSPRHNAAGGGWGVGLSVQSVDTRNSAARHNGYIVRAGTATCVTPTGCHLSRAVDYQMFRARAFGFWRQVLSAWRNEGPVLVGWSLTPTA